MPKSKGRKKAVVHQIPRAKEVEVESPKWYVYTMTSLMVVGVLAVLAYYIFSLNPWALRLGLVGIAVGFIMTVNWH
jgi:1,4-dihydroxy-2-naphthoate octaprenyltransferase